MIIVTLLSVEAIFCQQQFVYDHKNRLAEIDNGNCSGIKYSYDANGNRVSRIEYNISFNDSLKNETCPHSNDGSITLTANSNYTYAWSDGEKTPSVMNLGPGNYSVIVIDKQSGATCSKSFTILPQFIDSFSIQLQNTSCFGYADGSAKANIIIPDTRSTYTYNWNNSTDTSYTTVNSISNIGVGNYLVNIRNSFTGCIKSLPFSINQPLPIITDVNKLDNPCLGSKKGTATVYVIGDSSQYEYLWASSELVQSQTTQSIDSLSNGEYYVTVTQDYGNLCKMVDSVLITGSSVNNLIGIKTDSTTCFGSSDGTATAEVVGNSSQYSYSWFNSSTNTYLTQTSSIVIGLQPGNYTLTITDHSADSCKNSQQFLIQQANSNTEKLVYPNPTTGVVNILLCVGNNTAINYSVFTELGQQIERNSVEMNNSSQLLQIDLSKYSKGIYFVKLLVNTQQTTFRVIKL